MSLFLYLASEGCIAPLGACPVCLAGVGGPHTHRTGTRNAVLVLVGADTIGVQIDKMLHYLAEPNDVPAQPTTGNFVYASHGGVSVDEVPAQSTGNYDIHSGVTCVDVPAQSTTGNYDIHENALDVDDDDIHDKGSSNGTTPGLWLQGISHDVPFWKMQEFQVLMKVSRTRVEGMLKQVGQPMRPCQNDSHC